MPHCCVAAVDIGENFQFIISMRPFSVARAMPPGIQNPNVYTSRSILRCNHISQQYSKHIRPIPNSTNI